jgi:hypothetical protein
MRQLPILLLLACTIGCNTPTRYTFDVSVKNAASQPITVGFTKTGPPPERGWAAPEDFSNAPPSRMPGNWGEIVEPGKTASVRISGSFYRGVTAVLRVYIGDRPLADLLAMSRGTGDRIDLGLVPGPDNTFIITDPHGRLIGRAQNVRNIPRE